MTRNLYRVKLHSLRLASSLCAACLSFSANSTAFFVKLQLIDEHPWPRAHRGVLLQPLPRHVLLDTEAPEEENEEEVDEEQRALVEEDSIDYAEMKQEDEENSDETDTSDEEETSEDEAVGPSRLSYQGYSSTRGN